MSTIFSLPFDYYFWITNNNGLDKWGNSIRRDTKQSIESLKHSDKESKTKSTRFVPKHVLVHLNFLSALMRNDTTRQEKNLSFHSKQSVNERETKLRDFDMYQNVYSYMWIFFPRKTREIFIKSFIVCPYLLYRHSWTFFSWKYTYLWKNLQWKSIKGNIFKIFLLIHYNFSHEKNHRNKTVLLQRFISGMLTFFLH